MVDRNNVRTIGVSVTKSDLAEHRAKTVDSIIDQLRFDRSKSFQQIEKHAAAEADAAAAADAGDHDD